MSEPRMWVDEHGTLRVPAGYCFEMIDLPGYDTLGYPRKGVKLVKLTALASTANPTGEAES
jgi:hypothetical protein